MFVGAFAKTLVIELASFLHEDQHPEDRDDAAQGEDDENRDTIDKEHDAINDEVDHREEHIQRRRGQKALDALMIADALKQIPNGLDVEKRKRKPHQFDQKIGDDRNVDADAEVQQDPTPNKLDGCAPGKKHQLGDQNSDDEAHVLITDPVIDDGLREEWKDEAQHRPQEQPQHKLGKEGLVLQQIAEKKRPTSLVSLAGSAT